MGRPPRKAIPLEKAIQTAVLHHWRTLGLPGTLVAAIPNHYAHGQPGLTPGLPDLIVITPKLGARTGFIEMKTENGVPSRAQLDIRGLMAMRDIPYALTFGRDQPIQVLEEWGAVRPQAREAA